MVPTVVLKLNEVGLEVSAEVPLTVRSTKTVAAAWLLPLTLMENVPTNAPDAKPVVFTVTVKVSGEPERTFWAPLGLTDNQEGTPLVLMISVVDSLDDTLICCELTAPLGIFVKFNVDGLTETVWARAVSEKPTTSAQVKIPNSKVLWRFWQFI
jgi:hypothetical protein